MEQVTNVHYIEYDNLKDYDEDFNLLAHVRTIGDDLKDNTLDWMVHFNCISELRRLRKHAFNLFTNIFEAKKIYKLLPQYLESVRSSISKYSLILVSEIFSCFDFEYINKWVKHLLPVVIRLSVSNIKFIKEQAEFCINNAANNMFYEETFICLLDGVKNHNVKISLICFDALINFINRLDEVNLEYMIDWKSVFISIIKLSEIKRDPFGKRPYQILTPLKEKFGAIKFQEILYNCDLIGEKIKQIDFILQNPPIKFKKSKEDFSKDSKSLKEKILSLKGKENIVMNVDIN
jgi:hypothetical protein